MQRFKGAGVILTGAAGGIGRNVAQLFAEEGARLILSDVDEEGLEAVVEALRSSGAEVMALARDVTDEASAAELVEACLSAYGSLDVAVNNAGIAHDLSKLPKIETATMRRMIEVNLIGVFLALKAQIPAMEAQRRGVILNVASVAGVTGAPLLAAYAAAKHGVVGLTKTAAVESARKGVRINALCPSFTDTAMVRGMVEARGGDEEETMRRILSAIPMGRLAEAEEIARAVLWLCSPENSFMTGQALSLDGGLTAL